MSSEKLWVVILALVSFLAGLAGGALAAPRVVSLPDPGPFANFQARLTETFELSEQRRAALRGVMEEYQRRLEKVEARFVSETAEERARLGIECVNTIRKHVLPEEARAEFDLMAEGRWPLVAEAPPSL